MFDKASVRLPLAVILAGLFVSGCRTVSEPDTSLAQIPQQGQNPPINEGRVQIGDDNGKPIYRLGTLRVARATDAAQRVAYTPPANLPAGRFAFPDYQDPGLTAAIAGALNESFAEGVTYVGHSPRSYGYETTARPTRFYKRKIESVVDEVAARETMARRGPDGKWRPDYTRTVNDARFDIPPALRQSVASDKTARRKWLASLLRHVQTIPYGLPPNGFLFPDEVLTFNYGDCDSKAVLTAAMIKRLDPDLGYVFVNLPSTDHMLLGVALKPKPGDHYIKVKGVTYVLAEVSGPATLPLGEIASKSKKGLRGGTSYAILPSGKTKGFKTPA